jgi:hypothetical protein
LRAALSFWNNCGRRSDAGEDFPQPNAGAPTVFSNEFYAARFEGDSHISKRPVVGDSLFRFEVGERSR